MVQPHSPDNRALARECRHIKIDRVYIGSCTGGKTEDFMAAAKIMISAVFDKALKLFMIYISLVFKMKVYNSYALL
jgi:3-isopropylmalate/(R)-2-methylmalate dehydratase large subunit